MNFIFYLGIIFLVFQDVDGCFPRRIKSLRNSFLPASIQILQNCAEQLEKYVPQMFSNFCQNKINEQINSKKIETADICVYESLLRVKIFLNDLQREAVDRHLENLQGFGTLVMNDLRKSSKMSSIGQLQFVLEKLLQEETSMKCEILLFLDDLRNIKSKLHRNLKLVTPLKYMI